MHVETPPHLRLAHWKELNGKFDLIPEQQHVLKVAHDEDPAVVVVAGDVFDTLEQPPRSALRTWAWRSQELVESRSGGRPLFVIPGNRDHAYRMSPNAGLARPSGLHRFRELDRAHEAHGIGGIEFFGFPFHKPGRIGTLAQRHASEANGDEGSIGDFDYDEAMRWLTKRALNTRSGQHPCVAVAHAYVDGAEAEGVGEEPVTLGGTGSVSVDAFDGFNYVALGHIHRTYPLPGAKHVRYAGGLYPCAFDERSDKLITIVEWPDEAVAGTSTATRLVPLRLSTEVRTIEEMSFDDRIAAGEQARRCGDHRVDDFILVSVIDRIPIPHASSLLTSLYLNAQFEQRVLDVEIERRHDVPDPQNHTVEEMFDAIFRHVN
ncbi:MAG: metallophosphoesterase [Trueperaceae bacterium]|nr:metallophosphoesterase [Trueperaceae bacterium]